MREEVKELDTASLKALAHPLRLQLLARLRSDGPATATMLAQVAGESTGATSYHLRQLARHGFVEDDDSRGNARERWWRAVHRGTSWDTAQLVSDPSAADAFGVLQREVLRTHVRWLESWFATMPAEDPVWLEASTNSDYALRLTPPQLRALADDLLEVVERHREAALAQPESPEAQLTYVLLHAFPERPGR